MYGKLGTAATGSFPGSRFIAEGWTDSGDHLWLFGGEGYDATGIPGNLNELWEFSPVSN